MADEELQAGRGGDDVGDVEADQFWLALVNAVIVCGRLVRRAWTSYRWDSRPRRRP